MDSSYTEKDILIHSQPGCNNGEVRLQSTPNDPQKGLVLTCTSNQWRPVCNNNNWNTRVANMVCRQLGFNDQGE